VPDREDLIPKEDQAIRRTFSYGEIDVIQWADGSISVRRVENVPPDELAAFLKMLAHFVDRAAATPSAGGDSRASEAPTLIEEGPCQECKSIQQHADGEMRKCSGCGHVWRVKRA
jgi:hypothetical protein